MVTVDALRHHLRRDQLSTHPVFDTYHRHRAPKSIFGGQSLGFHNSENLNLTNDSQDFRGPKFYRMAFLDEFPEFDDGDVRIEAPTGHSWRLHSSILCHSSDVLDKIIQSNAAPRPNKKQKVEGQLILWKFDMAVTDIEERFVEFRLCVSKHSPRRNIAG